MNRRLSRRQVLKRVAAGAAVALAAFYGAGRFVSLPAAPGRRMTRIPVKSFFSADLYRPHDWAG